MKKVIGFMMVLGIIAAIPGLLHAMSHEKELPPAEGKTLHKYITETSPYEQWALWPGKDKFYKGTEPHGALLTTYVNEPAFQALKKNEALPEGSIIVKENYTPAKELAAVTVMFRKADFNPPAGNYFWLKYAPDGEIEVEGKAQMCIGCHNAAQGGDFLFTNDQ